jgi:WD40 repeat protein
MHRSVVFTLLVLESFPAAPVSPAQQPAAPASPAVEELFPKLRPDVWALTRDRSRVALATLAGRGGGVVVLDLEARRVALRVPDDDVRTLHALARSPDGALLASLTTGGRVEVRDARDGTVRTSFDAGGERSTPRATSRTIEFACGGGVLVVALGAKESRLWDARTGQRIAALTIDEGVDDMALGVSRDGELVALGNARGGVAVWRARGGERVAGPLRVPRGWDSGEVQSLDFDPRGEVLAIGAGDCKARLWRFARADDVREMSHCDEDLFGGLAIGCVRFSPDGARLVTTSWSFWEARLWDVKSGKRLGAWNYGGGNPGAMPAWFSADGQRVTLAQRGVVLDAATGKQLRALVPDDRIWVWFHGDGDLAWALRGRSLEIWNVESGQLHFALPTRWSARPLDRLGERLYP